MAIATDLYSYNNGTPDFLPTDSTGTHWIRMSDGFVRTDITSFSDDDLTENIKAFYDVIQKSKPEAVKGNFIKKVSLASTMGLGLKINQGDLR